MLNRDYIRLRMMKSAEELDWLRIGAHLSDLGMMALRDNLKPGINERELGNAIERAYVGLGGVNVIHFIGATPMHAPSVAVPRQFPSTRKIATGDAVSAEISAAFWDYSGQVLRSFTVGAEPTPLYRDLHAAADAAFDAIVGSAEGRHDAGRSRRGVAGDRRRRLHHHRRSDARLWRRLSAADRRLAQPSRRPHSRHAAARGHDGRRSAECDDAAITRAGVQTGELLLITQTGVERLHAMPRGFA